MSENQNVSKALLEIIVSRKLAEQGIQGLQHGGGGGNYDGMEGRVAALEAQMKITREDLAAIKNDVSTLKTDVATIKENLRHLPSKGFIVTATTIALSLVAAVTLLQGKLQAMLGLLR